MSHALQMRHSSLPLYILPIHAQVCYYVAIQNIALNAGVIPTALLMETIHQCMSRTLNIM